MMIVEAEPICSLPVVPAVASENQPRLAVMFHRLGPYHHARLRAVAARMPMTALEISNVDFTYAWDLVPDTDKFDKVTLFPGVNIASLSPTLICRRVAEVLDQLRPQAVAIPGWYDRCSLAALTWCVLRRVPAVFMSESTPWDDKRKWWKEMVKRQILKLGSAGLVGGSAHANYLENLGVDRRRIFSGYDAVDNGYFALGADEARNRAVEARKKLGLPERFFLASARFVKKKNLENLMLAFARYREMAGDASAWDLVILGSGPLEPTLKSLGLTPGLQGHVFFPGFKQYHELPAYYGLASVFVHASLVEQWGLVVNEAMASGLPVLVSNRCGCAGDLVQHGANGFTFDPNNQAELARLMADIASSGKNLKKMGEKSRQIADKVSPQRFADGMEAACNCAIAGNRSNESGIGSAASKMLIYFLGLLQNRNSKGAA